MKQNNMLAMILAGGRGSDFTNLPIKLQSQLSHMGEDTRLSISP